MALRVEQVGAGKLHVDARARSVGTQITDEVGFWGRMPHARRFRLSRFRSAVLALALVGAWLALVAAPPAALGAQIVHVFPYTGAMSHWTVPAGVHQAHFDVRGAQGGGVGGFPTRVSGGEGGRTVAEIRVFPGEVIHIFVGGEGFDGGDPCNRTIFSPNLSRGGFNGGGDGGCTRGLLGGGGGGGASDIRVDGAELSDRYIVAGGGGGASAFIVDFECGLHVGGGGGGLFGAHGVAGVPGCIGGTGGTQTSGGVQAGYPEGRGSLGLGGKGKSPTFSAGGGGGGGGYYGGGGGSLGAGGGGGSGREPNVDFPPVKSYTGVQKGNGQVIITWTQPD